MLTCVIRLSETYLEKVVVHFGNNFNIVYYLADKKIQIIIIRFINEICNINFNGTIVTYADDTCLLFSHESWDEFYEKACSGSARY